MYKTLEIYDVQDTEAHETYVTHSQKWLIKTATIYTEAIPYIFSNL